MNLRDVQRAFGRALRDGAPLPADGSPDYLERFDAYRNNAWQFFAAALEQTYPVVLRRVGAEFFRQLAREYRDAHPSRRGDLHWVGSEFPSWLATRMAATGYEWLAELAALEWAVANSTVSPQLPAISITALAEFAPESLADLRVELQPSLQMVAAQFPVWRVWQANQGDDPSPVDLAVGGECCAVACVDDRPVVYRLDPDEYRLLERLAHGDTLSDALEAVQAEADALGRVLAWTFGEQLVVAIVSPSALA
jgi:uncharacterized protein